MPWYIPIMTRNKTGTSKISEINLKMVSQSLQMDRVYNKYWLSSEGLTPLSIYEKIKAWKIEFLTYCPLRPSHIFCGKFLAKEALLILIAEGTWKLKELKKLVEKSTEFSVNSVGYNRFHCGFDNVEAKIKFVCWQCLAMPSKLLCK